MSWIQPTTGAGAGRWLRRFPFTVDFLAGANPQYVRAELSHLPDSFWDNVLSSGNDLRVTEADGHSPLGFTVTGWDHALKTGTLDMASMSLPQSGALNVLWGYYMHTGTPASAWVANTPVSPLNGRLYAASGPYTNVVRWSPERRGATKPRKRLVKQATETMHVWWDVSRMLGQRRNKHNGSTLDEEVESLNFQVLQGGVDQAALYTESLTRMVGRGLIRTTVHAGTSGQDYTASLTVRTTRGRTINPRAIIKVQTVQE